MKIAMASVYIGLLEVKSKFEPNRIDYCKKHGYDYFSTTERRSDRRSNWEKLLFVKELLPNYDWVMWLDSDALIVDYSKKLEDIINVEDTDFLIQKDGQGFNSGVFLIRNTPSSFEFIDNVWNHPSYGQPHPFTDQWPIQLLLAENAIKYRSCRTKIGMGGDELQTSFTWDKTGAFIVHWAGLDWVGRMRLMEEYLTKVKTS